jgi:hypothetical protein
MKTLFVAILGCLTGVLANAQSSFYFASSPSSWIGHGWTYTGTNVSLSFGNPGGNYPMIVGSLVQLDENGQGLDGRGLEFAGPSRQVLSVGFYPDARRTYFNGSQPGLNVWTAGLGDNFLNGWFQIFQLESEGGVIKSAAIDFMQFDEGIESRWNFGSLRFNSDYPLTTTVVPEPSSTSLLFLGFLGVLMCRGCRLFGKLAPKIVSSGR